MKFLMDENDIATYKYIEGFLYKKEDDKNWIEYWAQIRGRYFLFYKNKPCLENLREAFKGCIELTANTKCIVAKRKKYNFPFYVSTEKSKYLFKVVSSVKRHEWFKAIEMASQGKQMPPSLNDLDEVSAPPRLEALMSDEDKSSGDENVLRNAHINNSFASSEEDLSCDRTDATYTDVNCNPRIVMSTKSENPTSRFLDEADVNERLHEIFCADESESKDGNNRSKLAVPTFLYEKPTQYVLPQSRNSKLRDKKFFSSAEYLSDRTSHLTISTNREDTSHKTTNDSRRLSSSTHNIYSRHLVRSAPNMKTNFNT